MTSAGSKNFQSPMTLQVRTFEMSVPSISLEFLGLCNDQFGGVPSSCFFTVLAPDDFRQFKVFPILYGIPIRAFEMRISAVLCPYLQRSLAYAMTSSEESQVLVFFTVLAPDDFRRFKKFPIPYDTPSKDI